MSLKLSGIVKKHNTDQDKIIFGHEDEEIIHEDAEIHAFDDRRGIVEVSTSTHLYLCKQLEHVT